MVAKINSGSSLFGALTYNIDKVKNGDAHIIFKNNMIENISGNKELELFLAMKSFEPYCNLNDRIKKNIVHISLNPDPADILTDEQYKELTKEYMEKMGFKDQPFIVFKHEDIDRHHIHIVTVRVNDKGEKISDKFEHLRSMKVCRELETKFGLIPAIGKEKEFSEIMLNKIDYTKGDIKHQIANCLKSILDVYSFHSFGEYNALLSCYNIQAKLVKGERFNEKYNGIVYSATNSKGEIISLPFKSSLFGKKFGFKSLEKIMFKHNMNLKKSGITSTIKPLIIESLRNTNSKEDFQAKLKMNGIDAIFRENTEGRIYGVTYIDHKNKIALNGSRLGKELSANTLNQIFNSPVIKPEGDNILRSAQEQHTNAAFFSPDFGVHIVTHGDDLQQLKFDNELKRRKKKKGKRKIL